MMTLGGLTYLDLSDMERVGIKRNTLLVAKSRGATGDRKSVV